MVSASLLIENEKQSTWSGQKSEFMTDKRFCLCVTKTNTPLRHKHKHILYNFKIIYFNFGHFRKNKINANCMFLMMRCIRNNKKLLKIYIYRKISYMLELHSFQLKENGARDTMLASSKHNLPFLFYIVIVFHHITLKCMQKSLISS